MNSRSIVLNSGNTALLRAWGEGVAIPIGRFRVGDAYNFEPSPDAVNPVGNTVYTGYTDKISIDLLGDDELKVSVTFTEDVGPFTIGNLIIDLFVEDGYIPFLMWSSDIPIPKYAFNTVTGDIGNTLVLGFTEKVQNIDDALDINVLPTLYASLPQYKNENSLPPADQALFQNMMLQTFSTLYRPVVAARRSIDNTYFGFPLLDRLDNPFFGEDDGGIVGFNDAPFTGKWLWGGYLETTDAEFGPDVSFGSLSDKDDDYDEVLVGIPLNSGAE